MTQPLSNNDLDASCSPLRTSANSTPDRVEILRRLAALVAIGETQLPHDLPPDELRTILADVARLRRDRLVRFIARAIASDIESAGDL
jgi:hypothetical protein